MRLSKNDQMTQEEKIAHSKTAVAKAIFPSTTNHYDTLFGGVLMQWMDEVAFICATRYTRKKIVTVSSDKIDFNKAIPAGTIVELVAQVVQVGNRSLKVKVEVFVEEMYQEGSEKAVSGMFTFVSVN